MGNLEIERKFLVKNDDWRKDVKSSTGIVQGYLNSNPSRTVRVRVYGKQGFLTIKGETNESGTTRFEWEREIPMTEAIALIELCEPVTIDKVRHHVPVGKHVFEVDEFMRDSFGLIVAEIELSSENEEFEKPAWLGEEVTGKPEYYNSALTKNPFKNW